MLAKLWRGALWLAFAGVLMTLFVASGYLSFNLFVRRGVTKVPDLVGLSHEEATTALVDQGLKGRLLEESARFDEEVPRGRVGTQDPAAGSMVKRGSRIDLVPSLGPERVAVPDLRGQPLHSAQLALTGSGLTLGRAIGVFSGSASPGVVVDQVPPSGDLASPEESVDLFVSLDSRLDVFLMPDLVYRRYTAVRAEFERRGFRFGGVKFEPYEGVASGTILRQFPLSGHALRPRDVISLVVAADPPAS